MIEIRVMPNQYGVVCAPPDANSILTGTWVEPAAICTGPGGIQTVRIQIPSTCIPRPQGAVGNSPMEPPRAPTPSWERLWGAISKDQAEAILRAVDEAFEQEENDE